METGSVLSHYKITGKLGQGGMGEVYRADDLRLKRSVAIKVLSADVADHPERLARLEREAQLLAVISHPNIAAIHGLEESDGRRFLVMELAGGQSLAERLIAGPIAVEEALDIAAQIAEALGAAHEKAIVHRDLKPANIHIDPGGAPGQRVKVLDFGLAKALQPESAEDEASLNLSTSPTVAAGSQLGVILGTAAYMSPEQARGLPVDKRSDIWAFGCVLYEMLAGKAPFGGTTLTDTWAAILKEEPDWSQLPPDTPANVRRVLRRCLQKDPHKRLRDIGDACLELLEPAEDAGDPRPVTPSVMTSRRVPRWAWVVMGLLAFVTAMSLRKLDQASAPPAEPLHVALPLPPLGTIAGFAGNALAIAPDGSRVVFVVDHADGRAYLYAHQLDQREAAQLAGTEARASQYYAHAPFFSPDGRHVGFFADGQLKRVPLDGGPAIRVCDVTSLWGGATWSEDGFIYFIPNADQGLQKVAATGGTPEVVRLQSPDASSSGEQPFVAFPLALPGGTHALIVMGGAGSLQLSVVDLRDGTCRALLPVDGFTRTLYSASGHVLLSSSDGTVFAVPFDIGNMQLAGTKQLVLDRVLVSPELGVAHMAVADDGTLAYIPGSTLGYVAIVERTGDAQRVITEPRDYDYPRISPNGRKIAITVVDGSERNIWILDRERGTFDPLTMNGSSDVPIWFPDSERLLFATFHPAGGQFVQQRADGGDAPTVLLADATAKIPSSWSWNGERLAYFVLHPESGGDLWTLPAQADGTPAQFLKTPANEVESAFSPDGRFVAYTSDETGRDEVYVRGYPGPGRRWRISTEGGVAARWAQRGDRIELFYRNGAGFYVVDVETQPEFTAGKPRLLFENAAIGQHHFDVSRDGREIVAIEEQSSGPPQIHLILNWFEQLRQLAPGAG